MKSRNEIAKVLVFVMSMLVANSGFAAKGDVLEGHVIVVKRTTTLKLAKLLKTCAVDSSTNSGDITMVKCQVSDDRFAPTDVYPSTMIPVASKSFNSPAPFTGGISISAGGGQGVIVYGSFKGSVSLEEVKKAVTDLFEESKLEGTTVEFYAHVVNDKVG